MLWVYSTLGKIRYCRAVQLMEPDLASTMSDLRDHETCCENSQIPSMADRSHGLSRASLPRMPYMHPTVQ